MNKIKTFADAFEIKCKLLLNGINVDSFFSDCTYKPKIDALYFHSEFKYKKNIPQEIILFEDTILRLPVICNVRVNKNSKYKLVNKEGGPILVCEEAEYSVFFPPMPIFYFEEIKNYKISTIIQKLGINALGSIFNNYCSYYSNNQQCRYCEINPSFKRNKKFKQVLKPLNLVADSLKRALELDESTKYMVFTTGNFSASGNECAKYCIELMEKIKKHSEKTYSYLSIMPPDNQTLLKKLKKSGYDGIAFNMEVWEPEHFKIIVPGKAEFGYKKMIQNLKLAVDIFGKGNVYSNTVYGVQSLKGTDASTFDPKLENKLLTKCANELIEMNVIPLHTIYHTMGNNFIGKISLNYEEIKSYFINHAKKLDESGLIPKDRKGIIFDLGTISNHLYNDAYILTKYYL